MAVFTPQLSIMCAFFLHLIKKGHCEVADRRANACNDCGYRKRHISFPGFPGQAANPIKKSSAEFLAMAPSVMLTSQPNFSWK
jgi:hypothetical protein